MIPQYEPNYPPDLANRLREYCNNGGYGTEHKVTELFEKNIADYLNVKYCTATTSGTMALVLALLAAGIKPGDEVIVPNFTMIATANAVRMVGAIPILVDIEGGPYGCISDITVRDYVTKKTKALINVTLNGNYDSYIVDCLKAICQENKMVYIEDNAQSFGSCYDVQGELHKVGDKADIATYSFGMHKIISTGQGGCCVTNNPEYYQRLERLKDNGRSEGGHDIHKYWGVNLKFNDFLATIGLEQLKDIDNIVAKKQFVYDTYHKHSKHSIGSVVKPNLNWFIYTRVLHNRRNELHKYLKLKGIETRVFYPPIHAQESYKDYVADKHLDTQYKNSIEFSEQGLWLPSSMNLTEFQIKTICNYIERFYKCE